MTTLRTTDGQDIVIVDMARVQEGAVSDGARSGMVTTVRQDDREFGDTIVTYNGRQVTLRAAVESMELADGRDYGAVETSTATVAAGSGGASVTQRTVVDFGR